MEKKAYKSPNMRVVEVKLHHHLLSISGVDGNANLHGGNIGSNEPSRSTGHRSIWDSWDDYQD